jgi:hypothetical protein
MSGAKRSERSEAAYYHQKQYQLSAFSLAERFRFPLFCLIFPACFFFLKALFLQLCFPELCLIVDSHSRFGSFHFILCRNPASAILTADWFCSCLCLQVCPAVRAFHSDQPHVLSSYYVDTGGQHPSLSQL